MSRRGQRYETFLRSRTHRQDPRTLALAPREKEKSKMQTQHFLTRTQFLFYDTHPPNKHVLSSCLVSDDCRPCGNHMEFLSKGGFHSAGWWVGWADNKQISRAGGGGWGRMISCGDKCS